MSGGRFDYIQYRFQEIIDSIEQCIIDNNVVNSEEFSYCNNFSKETLNEFKAGIEYIKKAYTYIQRIDYLLSSDDDEESFHIRLKEDLNKL